MQTVALPFTPTFPESRRTYELSHILMLGTNVKMSPADQLRLGQLQTAWESIGVKTEEFVILDKDFSAPRYTLKVDGPAVDVHVDATTLDLLVRIVAAYEPVGYMVRAKAALQEFLARG